MLYDHLEDLFKEATLSKVAEVEEDLTEDELVEKLAEAVESTSTLGNSRLGVAKLLTAIDILGS